MYLDSRFSNPIQDMQNVYEWFVCNSVKAYPDKFRFIVLGNTGSHTLKIGDITIKSATSVTILSITIDSKLNFKEHFSNIEKKHIINYMSSEDYRVSNIRKGQNLSLFNDRKSICLLPINLYVLLKNRYAKS